MCLTNDALIHDYKINLFSERTSSLVIVEKFPITVKERNKKRPKITISSAG